ncbi:Aminopeptidase O [Holothuria leucospilota]|uniref:Aminopeptidase O n=1 Tax=Holothuria leucospilota TaxID=206669 RepID=A0A9Q1C627_HOLLE|nr:Aminopeptidase O [Holothuria leucospilota]
MEDSYESQGLCRLGERDITKTYKLLPSTQYDSIEAKSLAVDGENSASHRRNNIDEVLIDGVDLVETTKTCEWFTCVLDCCDISIDGVEEIPVSHAGKKVQEGTDGHIDPSVQLPDETDSDQTLPSKVQCKESERILGDLLGYHRCDFQGRNDIFKTFSHAKGEPLPFLVDQWSIKIWKKGVKRVEDFPALVRIAYKTRPKGQSLTWTWDQAGKNCVFTQGAWINNRSLFPCQEPPGAMATWQAFIQAPPEYIVLMSGDEMAERETLPNGSISHYFFVNMVMPPSMLALAVGQWTGVRLSAEVPTGEDDILGLIEIPGLKSKTPCYHEPWPCRINCTSEPVIPAYIYSPKSVQRAAITEFMTKVPQFLAAAFKILGPHPFSRLDFVIMPHCFASLGLASPSIVFISQTLIAGDGSFVSRLAHEISHSWFGLLIGAMDWTEEWLSEGFATFLEDPIQAVAEKWSEEKFWEISNLRALLRYRTLKSEVENTASELQVMRPMGGLTQMKEALQIGYVKNGLCPDKWFLQVHYLKGYFLLHYIADIVGPAQLLHVMAKYIAIFHGCLVLSKDFFKLLFETCPSLHQNGITQDEINREWLDSPGIPEILKPERFITGNKLIEEVMSEVEKWKTIDGMNWTKDKWKSKKKRRIFPEIPEIRKDLIPEQICLLLERLLQIDSLNHKTLLKLKNDFELHVKNADIRHRWCELVIKHRYTDGYGDIRMFLLKDQAMGVYLYGELLASEDIIQRLLAETCYEAVVQVMDRGCRRTVEEMLGIDQHDKHI